MTDDEIKTLYDEINRIKGLKFLGVDTIFKVRGANEILDVITMLRTERELRKDCQRLLRLKTTEVDAERKATEKLAEELACYGAYPDGDEPKTHSGCVKAWCDWARKET